MLTVRFCVKCEGLTMIAEHVLSVCLCVCELRHGLRIDFGLRLGQMLGLGCLKVTVRVWTWGKEQMSCFVFVEYNC